MAYVEKTSYFKVAPPGDTIACKNSVNLFKMINIYPNRTLPRCSMSVFILCFSHFDVNLFRHRHFRLIIVRVTKTNLSTMEHGVNVLAGSLFKEISVREGRFLLFSSEISLRKTV